jgi:hypothetical protein
LCHKRCSIEAREKTKKKESVGSGFRFPHRIRVKGAPGIVAEGPQDNGRLWDRVTGQIVTLLGALEKQHRDLTLKHLT